MSILEFKSSLLGGGARPNQFRVELNFPGFVSGGGLAGRKGQFLCTATTLPGSMINVTPVFYRGREVKLAGERQFQNWGVRVINDTDFAIHKAFEDWMKQINDPKENIGLTNPLLYTADMNVHQLDRNGAVIKSYKIADAWPVSISDIELSYGTNDQIEEFQVELAYAFWETTNSATSISTTIGISTPIGGFGVSI
jgi:hypothetical protein